MKLTNTQATKINNAVSRFFDASVSYDDARTQLTDALREAKLTREQIRPAVAAYVCQRIKGAEFNADKQTLVNNRNHANEAKRKAYEAAKRQISRILATADSTKPRVVHKVDPVEAEIKAFYRVLDGLSAKAKKQIAAERGYKF